MTEQEQATENKWWLDTFQENWLNPIVIVGVIILCFLLIRWISYSGYPIFGATWIPNWLYVGRGLTAFFEREQLSQIKQDDNGSFWTLFDPRTPLDQHSVLTPNNSPMPNELKIYAATNLFQRYWIATIQICLSIVHAIITLIMLPVRIFFSFFYYFKSPEWKQIHGNDAFYLIGEPPSVVWRNNKDVRGPELSNSHAQTDIQGNTFNWMSTLLSRIAFVTTFGMDRILYANLRMLPFFRINESRWGWFVIILAIFFLIYYGFYWITDNDASSIRGFIIIWLGILGYAWFKGGWKLAFYNPIHGLFPKLNADLWGRPTTFHDFFRSFLRNVYDNENGSLPTIGPLPDALRPPTKQQGGTIEQSLKQINQAERILLQGESIVPSRVIQAYDTYQNHVIPDIVYQAYEMQKYREQQEIEYKKKQLEMLGMIVNPEETSESQRKNLDYIAFQTNDSITKAYSQTPSISALNSLVSSISQPAVSSSSTGQSALNSLVSSISQPAVSSSSTGQSALNSLVSSISHPDVSSSSTGQSALNSLVSSISQPAVSSSSTGQSALNSLVSSISHPV